jgi:hypothetical protein
LFLAAAVASSGQASDVLKAHGTGGANVRMKHEESRKELLIKEEVGQEKQVSLRSCSL